MGAEENFKIAVLRSVRALGGLCRYSTIAYIRGRTRAHTHARTYRLGLHESSSNLKLLTVSHGNPATVGLDG